MANNDKKVIVNIEPYGFTNHLGNTFISIFCWMFFAFIVSIFITGNSSNEVFISLSFVCVTFALFSLNVIGGFRKPYMYIYNISIDNEIVTIKFLELFKDKVEETKITEMNLKLENEGNKNVSLIINSFNKKEGFCIKQSKIWHWNKRLMTGIYGTLNVIVKNRIVNY